jgi:hypothetical protein
VEFPLNTKGGIFMIRSQMGLETNLNRGLLTKDLVSGLSF